MRQTLKIHPDSRCKAVSRIEVEVARFSPEKLALRYVASGATAGLRIPARVPTARADELWKHTCFEVFIRPEPGPDYYEFNFSPSTQWAAYRFDGYRTGMAPANVLAPDIEVRPANNRLEVNVQLDVSSLPLGVPWTLGLSAVIEELGGTKSYWALAHTPGKPDFHHADCFAMRLPAANPA